jgi:hypothetical protein
MNTDELRGELTTLADEIEPFERDLGVLHRRERRRHVIVSSVVAALVVTSVVTIGLVQNRTSGKVHVSGVPSKEVPPAQITHIDAVVVPATPAVTAVLDRSPLVGRYTRVSREDLSSNSLLFAADHGLCALATNDGYVIDAAAPGTDIANGLRSALTGNATVYDESDRFGADIQIFMRVGIAREYSLAIQGLLTADPDVARFRYVSTKDAYDIFKTEFADQPALVQGTRPADLPESFRIILEPGRTIAKVVERYRHLDGVDTVITSAIPELFDPTTTIKGSAQRGSPCAQP